MTSQNCKILQLDNLANILKNDRFYSKSLKSYLDFVLIDNHTNNNNNKKTPIK